MRGRSSLDSTDATTPAPLRPKPMVGGSSSGPTSTRRNGPSFATICVTSCWRLTPLAMTLSPGHPFPRVRHLSLSLAVVVLDRPGATPHFAQVELPDDTPRLIPLPGSNAVIRVEELVRANLDLLYPSSVVEQAYAFRVTRGADLDLDEY